MSVLVECPICHQKQSLRNKRCPCGENLDKAKKASRAKYCTSHRLPVESPGEGEPKTVQRREFVGYSLEEAKDADGKRRGQKRENRIFEILPSGQMAFKELADWYCGQDFVKQKDYYASFCYYIANFNKVFGATIANKITTIEVLNYQAKRKKAGYSDSYVDHEVGAAKTIIYAAYGDAKVSEKTVMVFKKVPKLLKKKRNARKRILTPVEFQALMKYLPLHTKRMMVLNLYTGMRRGEITALMRPQIRKEKRIIELEATDTKDSDPRLIPYGDVVAALFDSIPEDLRDNHVFLYRGRPFKDIRTGLKRACKLAGIPYGRNVKEGFVFHDIRRTFNTFTRKAGVDKTVTKDMTGHDSDDMYDWYNVVDNDDKRLAVQLFENFMRDLLDGAGKKKKVDHFVDQRRPRDGEGPAVSK